MDRTPDRSPRRPLHDRLIACLWWLTFLGGVAAGTAAGLVLALWLALPPLPGLLLLAACWLGGNAAGWRLAARLGDVAARRAQEREEQIRAELRGAAGGRTATPECPARGHRPVRRAGKLPSPVAACR